MDIIAFLTARLDEDEALAELQPPWPWHLNAEGDEVIAEDGIEVATAFALSNNQQRNTAAFIAHHDPARVLREVAAMRAIAAEHANIWLYDQWVEWSPGQRRRGELRVCKSCEPRSGFMTDQWPCKTLKLLVACYADHPDFNPAWRVE